MQGSAAIPADDLCILGDQGSGQLKQSFDHPCSRLVQRLSRCDMTGCLVARKPLSSLRRSRRRNGEDYEESSVTRGLDFLKPSQSASNSWRMDAKASSYNRALIRSQSMRLLPSFAQTAWNKAQPRCWAWSTQNASLLRRAHTTERCCSPCP